VDPIGFYKSVNLFNYAGNSPLLLLDNLGLFDFNKFVGDSSDGIKQAMSGGIEAVGLIGANFESVINSKIQNHYERNSRGKNVVPVNLEAVKNDDDWVEMSPEKSLFHRLGPGAYCNRKFVSKDGRREAVYDMSGSLVYDPVNVGTYNFYPPSYPREHFVYDMLPYFVFGNSPGVNVDFKEVIRVKLKDMRGDYTRCCQE